MDRNIILTTLFYLKRSILKIKKILKQDDESKVVNIIK